MNKKSEMVRDEIVIIKKEFQRSDTHISYLRNKHSTRKYSMKLQPGG